MDSSTQENDAGLPPPGSRWGAGAQSVLPYLARSLQARPAAADAREPRNREPEREPPGRAPAR